MSSVEAQMLLGCTWGELARYLQQQLKQGETLRELQIDHIIPFASASKDDGEAKKRICHYSNLTLLTAEQNRSKGGV
jgi:hypothetical protein